MNKKLDVLVIEDTERHQVSARVLLADQNITIVEGFDYAMDKLVGGYNKPKQHYDAVLSDLLLPQGRGDTMGPEGKYLKRDPMAFGFPISYISAMQGIPCAVVTDMNHHDHPMSYTFNFLKGTQQVNETPVMFFDIGDLPQLFLQRNGEISDDWDDSYCLEDPQIKNWKAALDNLLGRNNDE
jgi:hypothetical protein